MLSSIRPSSLSVSILYMYSSIAEVHESAIALLHDNLGPLTPSQSGKPYIISGIKQLISDL